ncbi:MAG: hypothetical protein AB2L14_13560 [Candidatus Xenobiia bacterium LiM19]
MKPISIIIVEDRAILRENLSLALENSKVFSAAGHFNEAREALAFLKNLQSMLQSLITAFLTRMVSNSHGRRSKMEIRYRMLSDEHLIILTLAGKRKATKEIAEELGFTIAAVKHRFNEIFSFLECTAEPRRCLKL